MRCRTGGGVRRAKSGPTPSEDESMLGHTTGTDLAGASLGPKIFSIGHSGRGTRTVGPRTKAGRRGKAQGRLRGEPGKIERRPGKLEKEGSEGASMLKLRSKTGHFNSKLRCKSVFSLCLTICFYIFTSSQKYNIERNSGVHACHACIHQFFIVGFYPL